MFEGGALAVDRLTAAVDVLVDEDPADLSPTVALARLAGLLEARERLQAAVLVAVRDLDLRELYALDGAGSARGWLRTQPGGEDGQLVLARSLAQRPEVLSALATGRIPGRAARQLCTALNKVPSDVDDDVMTAVLVDGIGPMLTAAGGGTPEHGANALLAERAEAAQALQRCAEATAAAPADRLEPALVLLATRLTPNLLGTALRSLVDPLLPDGSDGDKGSDPYYLELRPLYDGDWDLRGLLDPETGQSLKAELERRRASADDRLPGAEVLDLFGEVPPVADETGDPAEIFFDVTTPRPARPDTLLCPRRRRHDELTQLLRDSRAARAGDGQAPPACLVVHASLDAVLGRPGALPALLDQPGRPPVPLASETLQRLGCSAEVAAVLVDAAGNPVGASSTRRSASRRERRALRARWGPTCAVRGCRSTLTVPHHVRPWWLSHETVLRDLVPLCEHCHRDLHEGHRTLRLRDTRWIDERGWVERPATALAS